MPVKSLHAVWKHVGHCRGGKPYLVLPLDTFDIWICIITVYDRLHSLKFSWVILPLSLFHPHALFHLSKTLSTNAEGLLHQAGMNVVNTSLQNIHGVSSLPQPENHLWKPKVRSLHSYSLLCWYQPELMKREIWSLFSVYCSFYTCLSCTSIPKTKPKCGFLFVCKHINRHIHINWQQWFR